MASKVEDTRMVLVGKTGVGKSAAGNTILGEKLFKSTSSSASVTSECQKKTGEVKGQTLAVVDTPGLFDTERNEEEVMREIAQCICSVAPGPHVFLVVIQAGRFTKEEQETVKIIQKMFGKEAAGYTMALFTRGDDLEADDVHVDTIVEQNQALSDFISQCGGRYHVFNNRRIEDPAQVIELLEKINKMVQKNGGRCYTNEMLKEAERAIEEERAKLQRDDCITLEEARALAEKNNEFIHNLMEMHLAFLEKTARGGYDPVRVACKRGSVSTAAATGAAIGLVGGPVGAALGGAVGALAGLLDAAREDCVIQ